jgi:hypothetical protein
MRVPRTCNSWLITAMVTDFRLHVACAFGDSCTCSENGFSPVRLTTTRQLTVDPSRGTNPRNRAAPWPSNQKRLLPWQARNKDSRSVTVSFT